jgi:hypothetical protein
MYGMATGYRSHYALAQDYPGIDPSKGIPIALEIIRDDPSTLLYAVVRAYRDYLQPTLFFSFLYLARPQLPLIASILSVFLAVGMARLIGARQTTLARMLFAVILGILLSIPFVPPIDDGIRAMITTVPFWALMVGLSVADMRVAGSVSEDAWKVELPAISPLLVFSFLMVLTVTLGWLFVRGSARPTVEKVDCDAGEVPVALIASPGSYINVVRNSARPASWLPDIRREDLRANLQEFPKVFHYDYFRRLKTEQSVLIGLNLADANKDFIWLMVPTHTIETFRGINSFCAVGMGVYELHDHSFFVHRDLVGQFQDQ